MKRLAIKSFVLLQIMLVITMVAGIIVGGSAASAESIKSSLSSGSYIKAEKPLDGATIVTVGIYPISIYDINFESNTFYLSAYVWLKWKGDVDPSASLEFANSVEEWGFMNTPLYEKPKTLADGSNYQAFRVNSRFYSTYDLRNYPLDSQELTVYLEDSTNTIDQIVFVPDKTNSGFDAKISIPGWSLTDMSAESYIHDYKTNFGDTSVQSDIASKYTSLKFSVKIERNSNLFYWKLLMPLLIVLLTNWLALLLKPIWVEVRTAMPATALLTVIFLQMSYNDNLPNLSYTVLMDKIYLLCYVFILLTLALIIWSNHRIKSEDEGTIAAVLRTDQIGLGVQVAAFVIAFILLLLI